MGREGVHSSFIYGQLEEMGIVDEAKEICRKWGWPDVEWYNKGKCMEDIEKLVKRF